MAYLTADQLKQLNVIPEIKECGDNIRLEALIDYCSAIIDAYVNKSFVSEPNVTMFFSGEGTKKLALTKRIYTIKRVQFDNYCGTVLPDVSTLKIVDKNMAIFSPHFEFPVGEYNVEVYGDFGWEQVPKDVLTCLVILCNGNFHSLNDEEILQHRVGPYVSERIGNYSYTKKAQSIRDGDVLIETTGDEVVDQILYKYKDRDFSIGVI